MRRISSISSLFNLVLVPATVSGKFRLISVRCYSDQLSPSKPPGSLLSQYRKLVEQGRLQNDPYQEKVALALQNLLGRLEEYEKDMQWMTMRVANI